jgi:hypothetical protein
VNKNLLAELVGRTKQMKEIAQGERSPTRRFEVNAISVTKLRSKLGLSHPEFAAILRFAMGAKTDVSRQTHCAKSLFLASALLLPRDVGARPSRLRKADCDGLFAAFHFLARAAASKGSAFSFVHRTFYFAARAAFTFGSHVN